MGNQTYHRSFIILKAHDSGYGLDGKKEPAGYCKMEIRKNQGKIQLYVQDLKPAHPQRGIYDVVLVSGSSSVAPVKLTSIQVAESGRGEFEIVFDPANVRDTGHSIDRFHAVSIVDRPLAEGDWLRYPLIGYSDKRIQLDWDGVVTEKLNKLYNLKAQEKPQAAKVSAKDSDQVPVTTIEPEEASDADDLWGIDLDQPDDASESQVSADYYNSQSIMTDENKEAADHAAQEQDRVMAEADGDAQVGGKADGVEIMQDDDSIFEGGYEPLDDETFYGSLEGAFKDEPDAGTLADSKDDEPAGNERKTNENAYSMHFGNDTYWSRVKDFYNRLFQNHKKVVPFDDVVGEVDWIRVEQRYEPMYANYYYQSGLYRGNPYMDHYLVGIARERGTVKYIIYGIPGIYSAVPPMSMHGFSRWLPVKNGYGSGYWLLYIDANSGNIAYPY